MADSVSTTSDSQLLQELVQALHDSGFMAKAYETAHRLVYREGRGWVLEPK